MCSVPDCAAQSMTMECACMLEEGLRSTRSILVMRSPILPAHCSWYDMVIYTHISHIWFLNTWTASEHPAGSSPVPVPRSLIHVRCRCTAIGAVPVSRCGDISGRKLACQLECWISCKQTGSAMSNMSRARVLCQKIHETAMSSVASQTCLCRGVAAAASNPLQTNLQCASGKCRAEVIKHTPQT